MLNIFLLPRHERYTNMGGNAPIIRFRPTSGLMTKEPTVDIGGVKYIEVAPHEVLLWGPKLLVLDAVMARSFRGMRKGIRCCSARERK